MLEDINIITLKIISLYVKNYSASYSIRNITLLLKINYSNAFKRVKELVKKEILLEKKIGNSNEISLNIKNTETLQILSFVEQELSKDFNNTTLKLIVTEALQIDCFSCIGIFGSRINGKATKESDWDLFIITTKRKEMDKIMSKFPFAKNIQLQVIDEEEFENSLMSTEETVVKHIIKNKQIIYNPYPFYNIIYKWEKMKYAPN